MKEAPGPGMYTVAVALAAEEVLEWEGYAGNVSDALYQAMFKHEDSLKPNPILRDLEEEGKSSDAIPQEDD